MSKSRKGSLKPIRQSVRQPNPPRGGLAALNRLVVACERCPRLRQHCERVAREKRRAYAEHDYWGRPVPTSGNARARLWVLGLAPAAHGANRTGRMFTGDRSGDFLYAALHRAGFASSPRSVERRDGTQLIDCAISAVARCAPPANQLTRAEVARCRPFLDTEWAVLQRTKVVLALGGLAWREALSLFRRHGLLTSGPLPPFGHAAECSDPAGGPLLLGSYHVSQQNTFTGRLTPEMLDSVLNRAAEIARAM
jgi:uracil-DNA glycosylase family 4